MPTWLVFAGPITNVNLIQQSSMTSANLQLMCALQSDYRIRGIIGKLNIWSKNVIGKFLIGGFEYCMVRNPCLQPKWRTFNLVILT